MRDISTPKLHVASPEVQGSEVRSGSSTTERSRRISSFSWTIPWESALRRGARLAGLQANRHTPAKAKANDGRHTNTATMRRTVAAISLAMAIAILLVAYASSGAFAIRASWMRAIIASFTFFASLLLSPAIAVADPFLMSPAIAAAASFDDVFAIMSLPEGGDSPGCYGCHINAGFAEPCPLS